jgi:hypothetical protein
MTVSSVLLLLVLGCPLMMMFMMRGGHGHGTGHGDHAGSRHSGNNGPEHESHRSTDELRRQRDELDREIAEREPEAKTPTVVGGGRG